MTKEQAIKLFESNFWEDMSQREIAEFQLLESRLCMPFDIFHKAIEEALGRPVYTHEFGLDREGLIEEFYGARPRKTLEEIINMIPEEKRIVLIV